MERYEVIRDIGSGNFGVAKLVRDVRTEELFAVKFIERGQMVTANYRPFLVPSSPQRSSFLSLSLSLHGVWSLVQVRDRGSLVFLSCRPHATGAKERSWFA